jgi:hypothetical protein
MGNRARTQGGERHLVAGFLSLALILAALQFVLFRQMTPTADGTTYLEVADQIERVGYAKALSLHWSPLYPLYVVALRRISQAPLEAELALTALGDVLLLLVMCATVVAAFGSLARLCWPDSALARRAWLSYAAGAGVFLAFAILRVGLRMPDVIVTILAVATLWLWCQACAKGLDWRWSAAAGLASGLAYLARTNLLHWSASVAVVACLIAPLVTRTGRARAFGAFALALLVFVGPQTYIHSTERGYFAIGESGRMAMAIAWGASSPDGAGAWPVRLDGGDVRVFPETRVVGFPGFYEPGREFDDAVIQTEWWRPLWGIVRSANWCLMGNWTAAFGLLWPAFWAIWPACVFAPASVFALTSRRWRENANRDPRRVLRERLAWLLMLAGAAGVAMHLLSVCNGYYMPPYFIAFFGGLTLDVLNHSDPEAARERRRAVQVVGIGFALAATLLTLRYFRTAEVQSRAANLNGVRALAAALEPFPPGPEGLRRIAASGNWLGLYGVRLSGSQIFADLPNPDVLHDPERLSRALRELRAKRVAALIVERSRLLPADELDWRPIPHTGWAIVDLRPGTAGAEPPS